MPAVRAAAVASANKRSKPTKRRRARRPAVDRHANIGCCGNRRHDCVAKWFRDKLRDKKWFQTTIIAIIFLAGIVVGIQTYSISTQLAAIVSTLDSAILIIFIAEIVIKLLAEGRYPHKFFYDAWNVFDFTIVVVGVLPFGGNAITALRLVRLLRVLKLVRALPKLRILVMGLLKSMSSIAYIGLLLMLLFYLYAVLGVSIFGGNDPVQMGTLHIAFLTLYRCATLEDWTDVMYTAMFDCEHYGYDGMQDLCVDPKAQPLMGSIYYCSFVMLSSMMILNLFIGVITSSMQDAKSDLSAELEGENASQEVITDEQVMESCLGELGDLMEAITDEVDALAMMERERSRGFVVHLSNKELFSNFTNKPTQGAQKGKALMNQLGLQARTGSGRPNPQQQQQQQSTRGATGGGGRGAGVGAGVGASASTAASAAAALGPDYSNPGMQSNAALPPSGAPRRSSLLTPLQRDARHRRDRGAPGHDDVDNHKQASFDGDPDIATTNERKSAPSSM